jgi:hypothetical protein
LKQSGEQIDDRIVEVHWDPENMRWRMMRFRDDKPNGNHISIVENIIQSIADGVEKDMVNSFSPFALDWMLNPRLAARTIRCYPQCLEIPTSASTGTTTSASSPVSPGASFPSSCRRQTPTCPLTT